MPAPSRENTHRACSLFICDLDEIDPILIDISTFSENTAIADIKIYSRDDAPSWSDSLIIKSYVDAQGIEATSFFMSVRVSGIKFQMYRKQVKKI